MPVLYKGHQLFVVSPIEYWKVSWKEYQIGEFGYIHINFNSLHSGEYVLIVNKEGDAIDDTDMQYPITIRSVTIVRF